LEAKVREARPADKASLMSFIKDVWGGHDYIPKVWDTWLHDKTGRMFVVEVGGVAVGMNRVRFLEDGSAWFEGARVHPGFRGKGLATLLGENSMKYASERGARVFRLTSGSRNHAAHRQISRIRFDQVARFSVYEPPKGKRPTSTSEAKRVNESDVPAALALIKQSKEYSLSSGLFWHDFTAASLTRPIVEKLAGQGMVWRAGQAVAIAQEGGEGSEKWEEVSFLGGPQSDAMKLVRALVGRRKAAEKWLFLPQGSPIIHSLRSEGYARDFAMILFERRAFKS